MGAARDSPHLHLSPLKVPLLPGVQQAGVCIADTLHMLHPPHLAQQGKRLWGTLTISLAKVGIKWPWQHPHMFLLSLAHCTECSTRVEQNMPP